MGNSISTSTLPVPPATDWSKVPVIAIDMPVMYEDEGQEEMGETDIHRRCCDISCYGLGAHLHDRPQYRVFSDLNILYHRVDKNAYVSPDTCAVKPFKPLPEEVTSYRIGDDGPAPEVMLEVLSKRSAQQQDLTNKPTIYAQLKIPEYILIDVTGTFLAEKLLLKKLDLDSETWTDHQDQDGGVTSRLGFRIIIEDDGMIRLLDAKSGKRYLRPEELEDVDRARLAAEERVQELEAEIERLRQSRPDTI